METLVHLLRHLSAPLQFPAGMAGPPTGASPARKTFLFKTALASGRLDRVPWQPRTRSTLPVRSISTASAASLRSHGALGVADIARLDLSQKGGKCNAQALFFQLLIATFCAFFGAGGQENLVAGVREDHRTHIPAIGDQPRRPAETELLVDEGGETPPGSPLPLQLRSPCGFRRWRHDR